MNGKLTTHTEAGMKASATHRFMVRKVVDGRFMLFGWSGWVTDPNVASWLTSEKAVEIQKLYGGEII